MKKIKIEKRLIGEGEPCFIVAEAGVNHDGDFKKAKLIIDAVSKTGADAIKFQTWKTESIILKATDTAVYQKENTGSNKSQFEMLKLLELQYDSYFNLKKYAEKKGLILFSTMEDRESVDFLMKRLKVPVIKVGSGDLTNHVLLKYTAWFKKPIILSTGMATIDEVEEAIKIIYQEGNTDVILLQCTTQYPCPYSNANINAMVTLRDKFETIVGFSEHTMGIECAIAAVALGAKVIEKHITLDKTASGPDHRASLNPIEFSAMVKSIRNIEGALGAGVKKPSAEEIKIRKVVVRKIVAARNLAKGEVIRDGEVFFKRANSGIEARHYRTTIEGRVVKNSIKKDALIKYKDLE